MTGNEQLLLQAQITTYSGAIGGMALEGNFRAKIANPDDYTVTLDQFSHEIDQAVVELAKNMANSGQPEEFTTFKIMEADRAVWAGHYLADHFPGNIQFTGIPGMEHIVQTPGSKVAILAQDEMELGRRPSEYANDPDYTIKTSDDNRFITVINNETNRIEVFFDNQFDSDHGTTMDRPQNPDLEQLVDELPSSRILAERQVKMDFLQAGSLLPPTQLQPFNENNARPIANLDRVFEYEGKFYQVSDQKLLENSGIDFEKLVEGNLIEGGKYLISLQHSGHDLERMIENRDYITDVGRQRAFEEFKNDGVIVELTDKETQAYQEMLQSLEGQGLSSPYQSSDEAHKELNNQLQYRF